MADLPPLARGDLRGTCAFRLMPDDDFAESPSTASVTPAAAGAALLVAYTWRHPDDGEQAGTLLLGGLGDDGTVTAAWVDSWHQRVVGLLHGLGGPGAVTVGYEYAPGWRWDVVVAGEGDQVSLVMHNVVPAGQDGFTGAYEVMRATWGRRS